MRKRIVKLHGRHCEISVHREGKIAIGDYLGKELAYKQETLARKSVNDGGITQRVDQE